MAVAICKLPGQFDQYLGWAEIVCAILSADLRDSLPHGHALAQPDTPITNCDATGDLDADCANSSYLDVTAHPGRSYADCHLAGRGHGYPATAHRTATYGTATYGTATYGTATHRAASTYQCAANANRLSLPMNAS
jgi:hypothetical protein